MSLVGAFFGGLVLRSLIFKDRYIIQGKFYFILSLSCYLYIFFMKVCLFSFKYFRSLISVYLWLIGSKVPSFCANGDITKIRINIEGGGEF